MQEISASKLAELLEEGFQGFVKFKGVVYGRRNEQNVSETNATFYEAQGNFNLWESKEKKGMYHLSLENKIEQSSHRFRFEKREDEKVSHSYLERYGDIILVPIAFPEHACLQIEPRDTILF